MPKYGFNTLHEKHYRKMKFDYISLLIMKINLTFSVLICSNVSTTTLCTYLFIFRIRLIETDLKLIAAFVSKIYFTELFSI